MTTENEKDRRTGEEEEMMSAPEELFAVPEHDGAVLSSWERFLAGLDRGPHAVRNPIDQSWRRCASADVDHRRDRAPPPLGDDAFESRRDRCTELIEAGAPVMASARDFLRETGTVMVLADPRGLILSREGDAALRGASDELHLMPGADWSEYACGTNAIGTAIETGRPIQIHSNEHFCEGIKAWSCSASVIRDPLDGSILGAVDVSGLRRSYSRHSMALVVATAARIENRMARIEMDLRYRLLERCLDRLSGSSDGIVIFDRHGRAIRADADLDRMMRDLGASSDDVAAGLAAFGLGWEKRADRPKLPDWLDQDWLTPIHDGGLRLGAVMSIPGRHAALTKARRPLARPIATPPPAAFAEVVGSDPALRRAIDRAARVAPSAAPVLLLGETGVGKEVFARSLHAGSRVAAGPFVALNCGGLSRDLLTSELFGYAEGSFTGARKGGMMGKIEAADGGTLFLDEIGEMPLDLQPLFLRVLEEREVCRIGETRARKVDFRLVAATNRDLRGEVEAGRFRRDLFYRVSVVGVTIPPLRERKADIPALAEHFAGSLPGRHGLAAVRLTRDLIDRLVRHDWPGNIRELRNVVESMILTAAGPDLDLDDLPSDLVDGFAPAADDAPADLTPMERAERSAILTTLRACRGNLAAVARELGIAKSTLYVKLRKFGLGGRVDEHRG